MSNITVTSESIVKTGLESANLGLALMLIMGAAAYFGFYTWYTILVFILGALFFWSGHKYAQVGLTAESKVVYEAMHGKAKQPNNTETKIEPTLD